jgi:hypothetical protein
MTGIDDAYRAKYHDSPYLSPMISARAGSAKSRSCHAGMPHLVVKLRGKLLLLGAVSFLVGMSTMLCGSQNRKYPRTCSSALWSNLFSQHQLVAYMNVLALLQQLS